MMAALLAGIRIPCLSLRIAKFPERFARDRFPDDCSRSLLELWAVRSFVSERCVQQAICRVVSRGLRTLLLDQLHSFGAPLTDSD